MTALLKPTAATCEFCDFTDPAVAQTWIAAAGRNKRTAIALFLCPPCAHIAAENGMPNNRARLVEKGRAVAAERVAERRAGIAAEKLPDTPVDALWFHGVKLSSRYQKAAEMELMAAVVERLAPADRKLVASMWCDSKNTNDYTVTARSKRRTVTDRLAKRISAALLALHGGHNGVTVGESVAGPDWLEGEDWAGPYKVPTWLPRLPSVAPAAPVNEGVLPLRGDNHPSAKKMS